MPSPFPGMDPYLEDHWRDVHTRFMVYLCDAIQESLPSSLCARVEERVVLETPEGLSTDDRYPDVRVIEFHPESVRPRQANGTSVAEPIVLVAEKEPLTETYIEIINISSGNKVVTILEVLSPTNKSAGAGKTEYKRKQREICNSDTSLVEIDLLRGGEHTLAIPLERIPDNLRTHFMVCVRRAWVKGMAEVYPVSLSEPLPRIRIPLRPNDADVIIALQPLIEQCYRRAGYGRTIDYKKDPDLPFSESEAEWVDQLLRKAGLRTGPPRKPKRNRRRKPPDGN